MTPEREAQMREMFETYERDKYPEWAFIKHSNGEYRSPSLQMDLETWLACARALEPKLKDGERYRWLREESGPTLRAAGCLRSDNVLICGKHLDDAIDKAMSAALEDGNANQ